jgi:hypothetical protein
MDPIIWVALIVFGGTALNAFVAFRVPIIVSRMSADERHAEREEDHARQDRVREQVEATARLQALQNRKVEVSTAATNDKLDEIHVAVNSNLAKAQIEALDAKDMLVVVMTENLDMRRSLGLEPTKSALEILETTKARALELRNAIHPSTR